MTSPTSVCHVVNAINDTSMPGDLATAQTRHEDVANVGILSWFDSEPFRGEQSVEVCSLDIPGDAMHVTPNQYSRAKRFLSTYDIVHTHHNHAGFYGKLIARRLGKPIITTDHNNHQGFTMKGRLANAVTNPVADHVVCVSDSVRESFATWERLLASRARVSVIPNGVDLDRVTDGESVTWSIHDDVSIDPNAVVVGSAGMLVEQKAHSVLIEAVDRANAESDRPIELVISGDGDLRADLERQIRGAEYRDRHHLLGFLEERDQVYKMMHEVDMYAMPSRWEGFCVAALEGMAAGNACIFSDIPEFKVPFESGATFHTVDDPTELSREIVRLASDLEGRRKLGQAAEQLVTDRYTLRQTVDRYVERYVEIA